MPIKSPMKNELKRLARKYGLLLVVLFGSQATGQTYKDSDADVAVYAKRALRLMELAELSVALQTIVKNTIVDVVDIHNAPPLLRRQIFSVGIPLYEGEPHLFYRQQIYADKLYYEAKPLFAVQAAYVQSALS